MQPPVFLADRAALESDVVVLSGAEGRHAATVRRLRPGERADIADGAGLVAECVVAGPYRGGADGLELTVLARRQEPPPDPAITVVQALPKGDRGELAVEEMTEVGVDRIVPWAAARSITVWQCARGGTRPRQVAADRPRGRQAVPPRLDTRGDGACRNRGRGPAGGEGRLRDRPRARCCRQPRPPQPPGSGDLLVVVGPRAASRPGNSRPSRRPAPSAAGSGQPCYGLPPPGWWRPRS